MFRHGLIAVTWTMCGAAAQASMTGNAFLELAMSDRPAASMYTAGLIDGIVMSEISYGPASSGVRKPPTVCIPDGVTPGQVVDMLVKELREAPAARNQAVVVTGWFLFAKTWPCSTAARKR